ncbi:hypothetical protein EJ110_NYTH44218 [Nymphaea thermarum]|nr:hypothetical protein EJ110_NYTH44218 [Nymphaea thermarum]
MWEPSRERQVVQRNQPRIPQVRIDFPGFNGKEPLDWNFQVEEYFTCQLIPKEEWLQTSTLHFDGEARWWYGWLKLKEPVNTWEEFKEALLLRFGESSYVDYDVELQKWDPTHRCKHIRVYTIMEQESYDEKEDDQPPVIEEVDEAEAKEEPQKLEEPPPDGACHMMTDPNQPDAMRELGDKLHLRRVDLIQGSLQIGLEQPQTWPRAVTEGGSGLGSLLSIEGLLRHNAKDTTLCQLTLLRVGVAVASFSCFRHFIDFFRPSTMAKKKQVVADSPDIEEDTLAHEEQASTELEVHVMERVVHIENEVLRIRHEMCDYKKQLSKVNELEEIKVMIRTMFSNQEGSRRTTHGPPPHPNLDKGKGVLGGPPYADPTPWHLQAGPSRPPPGWNNDNNGGQNGHHVGHNDNNGGHNGHHVGRKCNNGGQHYSSPELGNRDPYGPQASQEHQVVQRNQPIIPQVCIDFPCFYGKEPLDWIFQVEEYFTCQLIPEEEWLQTSTLHFDGEARRWYRWLKLKEPVNTWEEFKEALLLRFGESSYVDYDIELCNLKQTSTVQVTPAQM